VLVKEWKAESSRKAIDKFKEAAAFWSATDQKEQATALKRIGDISHTFGEFKTALSFYEQSLLLRRHIKDIHGEAESLNDLSFVYISLSENQKALKYGADALKLGQSLGDKGIEARALNNIGEAHNWLGDVQKALDFYRKALTLWTELNDRSGMAQTHTYLGFTFSDLGQVQMAFDSYQRALSLWQSVNDKSGEGTTLTAIGRLHSRLGDSQEALAFFDQAFRLMQPMGDPIGEARILNGMAYVYDRLGERRRALEYYNKALVLHQSINYLNGLTSTLHDIASVYYSLEDYEKALNYYQQVLAIAKAISDKRVQSYAVRGIGMVYDASGNKAKALGNYLVARQAYHDVKDLRGEAEVLNLIGRHYETQGQLPRGIECYQKALSLARQAEYRAAEAANLYSLARVERDTGSLAEARGRIETALKVIESLRARVASQDLRASYFATVRQHYELYVDILMRLHKEHPTGGFDAEAFDASEKARARSLLESLKEARFDIREGVDPSLLGRERKLEQELNGKAERQAQLLAGKNVLEAQAAAREIDQLTAAYDEVRVQIKSKSPRYAALTQPQPLTSHEVQREVLDDNSLLLEYMLGDERSYVWLVTNKRVSSFELPARKQIEDSAHRLYKLLTAHQPASGETSAQRQARVVEAEAQLPSETATLSKLLLAPIADKLGTRRLLIAADGALQYIPFQALSLPASAGEKERPLVLDHEIVNEPSASTLALVLNESRNRKVSNRSVAILADPVFEIDDSRVKSSGSVKSKAASTTLDAGKVTEALRDVGVDIDSIPRLLSSREEAEAIISLVPWRTGFKAVDFEANRATAMASDLAQYRIVHFATHALLNNEHPELSGIVLSLVDQKGERQDGFLRLHDIYNLKLPVDLVVLSACQTGLGKDVRGEGLIGLTRGFMYAGASGVVASLWKVDDDATAALMKHFYAGMFDRGLSPAAALREAQLAMREQKRWQAPYYWAGFVIQGQYAGKAQGGYPVRPEVKVAILGGLGIILLSVGFIAIRRRRRRIL
jgi:CHAT domain-containing protein/tetratricopeptide (TPR) repeat protein